MGGSRPDGRKRPYEGYQLRGAMSKNQKDLVNQMTRNSWEMTRNSWIWAAYGAVISRSENRDLQTGDHSDPKSTPISTRPRGL